MIQIDKELLLKAEFFHPAFGLDLSRTASAGTRAVLITCKGYIEVDGGGTAEVIRAHNDIFHSKGGPSCQPYQMV